MKVVTVGRDTQNDVVIDDPYVGRNHLQIIQTDDGSFYIVDFGSKNGTYVNGNRIYGKMELSFSDVVQIGDTVLPWRTYFPVREFLQETKYQVPVEKNPVSEEFKPWKRKREDSVLDYHGLNEVKIDYNEGGFGRKFAQAAGDISGNIVGCFVGIVIVIVLIILIVSILF